jgi:hypothetical protein
MAALGDPTEVDRLALQIEALRGEISSLEMHNNAIKKIESYNTKDLTRFKKDYKARALVQAEALRAELEGRGVRHMGVPPASKTQTTVSGQKFKGGRGGEWDAFNNLHAKEKARLRKNWTIEGGYAPDQMALEMGADSSDQAFSEFIRRTREIDMLEYYGKTGRLPKSSKAYGGSYPIDGPSITNTSSHIDLRILHDSDLKPTEQLAYLKEELIIDAQNEADRYGNLPNGIRPIEDAVSENYKLQDLHKAHVQAMNQHLSDMEDYELFTSSADEIFYSTRDMQDRKKDLAQRFKDEASKPKTQAQVNKEAAIARGRSTKPTQAKPQSTLKAGKLVPQRTAQTQAQINLEAARARGRVAGPADEAVEYAEKAAAGYFDDDYFNTMSESVAYVDDVIPEYEVLDGPIATIASSAKAAGASRGASVASAVATGAPSATRASATLSSAVSKGGKNAHLNLKTAAAASALGLAGGYVANRKRTRR